MYQITEILSHITCWHVSESRRGGDSLILIITLYSLYCSFPQATVDLIRHHMMCTLFILLASCIHKCCSMLCLVIF